MTSSHIISQRKPMEFVTKKARKKRFDGTMVLLSKGPTCTSVWWSGEQSIKRLPVMAKPSGALCKMGRPNRNSEK